MWTWDEGAPKRHRRLFFEVPQATRVNVDRDLAAGMSREECFAYVREEPPRPSRFDLELFLLGEAFTVAELQRAYRLLARDAHPDRGGDAEEFVGITNARDRLLPFAR
jgi:hypothetical protein